jgi:integrative and conjugative element protein (TIGR02256 family)
MITVSGAALRRMEEIALNSDGKETGGIVLGFNVGKDIQVTDVSGPGPNADRSPTHCLRDTGYCREFLAEHYKQTGADYVGEWHSHVINVRSLSMGDIGTLVRILVDPDYDFVTFAVFLVIVDRKGAELLVYGAERIAEQLNTRINITELYRGNFPNPPVSK